MGKIGYKGFARGLVCRGYKFSEGETFREDKCKTIQCGFHYAENPLDCLSYYPNVKRSEYCIVSGDGDIDEDATDSKISCTELTILRKMTVEDYILHCLLWICRHPKEEQHVQHSKGKACGGYAIVKGRDPIALGEAGDVLGLVRTGNGGKVEQINVITVTEETAGKWIDIEGQSTEGK